MGAEVGAVIAKIAARARCASSGSNPGTVHVPPVVVIVNTAHRDPVVVHSTLATKLKTYTAPTVLVIDDVGLLPITDGGRRCFFQVVNQRYDKGHPTLVTTTRSLPRGPSERSRPAGYRFRILHRSSSQAKHRRHTPGATLSLPPPHGTRSVERDPA